MFRKTNLSPRFNIFNTCALRINRERDVVTTSPVHLSAVSICVEFSGLQLGGNDGIFFSFSAISFGVRFLDEQTVAVIFLDCFQIFKQNAFELCIMQSCYFHNFIFLFI